MMASVTKATQSSPARLALPVALLLSAWAISTPLAAQQKRGTSRQQQQAPAAAPAPKPATADAVEVANEATLFVQPDNGVAGSLKPGATGRIVGQSGDWVRVQVEGWVKASDLKESTEGVLVGISAAEVRANPDRFVGMAAMGGGRLKPEFVEERVVGARRIPYLLLHGLNDVSVPLERTNLMKGELERLGFPVELATFEAGHEMTAEMLGAAREWFSALNGTRNL